MTSVPLGEVCNRLSVEETLEILGTPGALGAIREGREDAAAGRFADNEDVEAHYGLRV